MAVKYTFIMNKVTENSIKLIPVTCCVCGSTNAEQIGSGYDYEYHSCSDIFSVSFCKECENVYLNPRPDVSEFQTIYPSNYHSLDFSEENYGFVHNIRSRLEANRLLNYCKNLPDNAKILDVGCGDGFHLKLLQQYGEPTWTLEGVDIDSRVVEIASKTDLIIHHGTIEDLNLGENQYDVVYTIQTIEHVAHPDEVFRAIFRVLKPGGRLVIVTDNTDSLDFRLFKSSYWGGYHFPRHWNLFNQASLSRLAKNTGYEVNDILTIVSPVNWVYSFHNYLVDKNAPRWLINQFTLKSPISLTVFTLLDMILQKIGRGALLNAYFTKPS